MDKCRRCGKEYNYGLGTSVSVHHCSYRCFYMDDGYNFWLYINKQPELLSSENLNKEEETMTKQYRIVKVPVPGHSSDYKHSVQRKRFGLFWIEEESYYDLQKAQQYIEGQRTRMNEVISEHEIS